MRVHVVYFCSYNYSDLSGLFVVSHTYIDMCWLYLITRSNNVMGIIIATGIYVEHPSPLAYDYSITVLLYKNA